MIFFVFLGFINDKEVYEPEFFLRLGNSVLFRFNLNITSSLDNLLKSYIDKHLPKGKYRNLALLALFW